jgi:hypothetical protein
MSYFVTVTFDFRYADPNVYPKIQKALEEIDFTKIVSGRKHIECDLPANTFVAEFDSNDYNRSAALTDFVSEKLREIFFAFSVKGRFFVSAGQKWAWKHGHSSGLTDCSSRPSPPPSVPSS